MRTLQLNEKQFDEVKKLYYDRRDKLLKELLQVDFVIEQIKKIETENEADLTNTEGRDTVNHSTL